MDIQTEGPSGQRRPLIVAALIRKTPFPRYLLQQPQDSVTAEAPLTPAHIFNLRKVKLNLTKILVCTSSCSHLRKHFGQLLSMEAVCPCCTMLPRQKKPWKMATVLPTSPLLSMRSPHIHACSRPFISHIWISGTQQTHKEENQPCFASFHFLFKLA